MKNFILLAATLLLIPSLTHARTPTGWSRTGVLPVDSVGVEKKGGKRFILHRVDQGQTLFSIARRYGRSVASLREANPDMTDAVRYGQVVRVPMPDRRETKALEKAARKQEKESKESTDKPAAKPKASASRKSDDPARAGIHVVEPGQTLYSLALRYGVAQADLRKWNNLPTNNVLIGQALIVSEKAHQDRMPASPAPPVAVKTPAPARPDTPARTPDNRPEPAKPEPTKPEPERPATKRTEEPATPEPSTPKVEPPLPSTTLPLPKPADAEPELPRPGNDAPMPIRGRRIASSGIAEMIQGADGSGKYLALHRNAPIGTLVQVRNEFNNQSLWVKVIGRLPNTGINDKILIKLSTQAFTKLSPGDARFRAEVSYIAP